MRTAQFSREQIVDAAFGIVAEKGPTGASISGIGKAVGAPTGSIYHRFSSRDVLLGEVWLKAAEAFQSGFADRINAGGDGPLDDGLITYLPRRVRRHPAEARILLLHRREEFLDEKWPDAIKNRAGRLGRQYSDLHRNLCRRICDRNDPAAQGIVRYAIAGAPIAAVRPYLEQGKSPPHHVDDLVRATFYAAVELLKVDP